MIVMDQPPIPGMPTPPPPPPPVEPTGYAPIGNYGQDLDVTLMRCLVCTSCGALVVDTTLHDRVHTPTDQPKPSR